MGMRRVFSREYKLEAVKLVTDRGVAVAQAARDLGLHENVLQKWGKMKPEAAELDRLRKEVQKLRTERDILKKAAAYFAKESIGYYGWLTRPRSQRERDDEVIGMQVRQSFLGSDRTYGARR
eukprot:gene48242-59081_t